MSPGTVYEDCKLTFTMKSFLHKVAPVTRETWVWKFWVACFLHKRGYLLYNKPCLSVALSGKQLYIFKSFFKWCHLHFGVKCCNYWPLKNAYIASDTNQFSHLPNSIYWCLHFTESAKKLKERYFILRNRDTILWIEQRIFGINFTLLWRLIALNYVITILLWYVSSSSSQWKTFVINHHGCCNL